MNEHESCTPRPRQPAAVAASIPHTPAVAGPVVPVDTPAAVAVDDARDHVFIAGGDVVAVTDTHGDEVATLDLADGADARDLAIEGTTLFVSLLGLDAVARYDITTLDELPAIDLPDPVFDPTNLALSGGSLWVSWGACGTPGGLASIDGDAVEVYTSDELPFIAGDCAGAALFFTGAGRSPLPLEHAGYSCARDRSRYRAPSPR